MMAVHFAHSDCLALAILIKPDFRGDATSGDSVDWVSIFSRVAWLNLAAPGRKPISIAIDCMNAAPRCSAGQGECHG